MRAFNDLETCCGRAQSRLSDEECRQLRAALQNTRDAIALLEEKYVDALRDREVVHSLLEKTSSDLVRRYQTIFEYSGTTMLVLERDGTFSLANTYAESLLGYPKKEIEHHMRISDVLDTGLNKKIREFLQYEPGSRPDLPQQFEGEVTGANGKTSAVSVTIGRFPETGQCIVSLQDISDRRRAEDALALANKKLNLLNSVTRHDVNNRLFGLEGFIQLASRDAGSSPAVRSFLEKGLASISGIRDLIDFTKYYQDLGVSCAGWHDVSQEILAAASEIAPGEMTVTEETGGLEIYCDPLIRKVFYNLIDNALRHGQHATILSFTLKEETGGFVIVCADNGVGVPNSVKERIFERGFGNNTGLGLFLIREILSITGITIRETGIYGEGGRFEIYVPPEAGRISGPGPVQHSAGQDRPPARDR